MKFSEVKVLFELVTFLTKLFYGLQVILMQKGYVNFHGPHSMHLVDML